MTYQIIFFDLDGTLIDPKDSITKSAQYALSKFGINEKTEDLTSFIGPPLLVSLNKYYGFNEEKSQQASEYYREYFLEHGIKELIVYNGAIRLLEKLKKQNKILCVVSSKFKISAQRIVEEQKLGNYFESITATNDDQSNVHKSMLIKEALALYPEYPKHSFVMVGDTELDIHGAKTNRIDSIGVLYGYGSEEKIRESKPTYTAKTIKKLEQLLTKS
jgi:phosphoglycolate phosphatase